MTDRAANVNDVELGRALNSPQDRFGEPEMEKRPEEQL
jgi:hypothetical protein